MCLTCLLKALYSERKKMLLYRRIFFDINM